MLLPISMITGLNILEIAIGLSLVYLLLSLICSAVSEGLETILKNRSRDLERGLRELLSDKDGTKLVHLLYNHPLISGLFRETYQANCIRNKFGSFEKIYSGKTLPSYIPSSQFALALMDILVPADATTYSGASGALTRENTTQQAITIDTLRSAAAAFPIQEVSRALLVIIDASANDVKCVRENVESWFDHSMERIAGWYKRRTQIIIFVVAIVTSGLLNLDTIEIAHRLATDSVVRSSLMATAEEYAKRGDMKLPEMEQNIDKLVLGIPIGWSTIPTTPYQWLLKLFGTLASALAATLGAPFWFDVLSRFAAIRSTVKPKTKSPSAAAKG